MGGPNPEAPNPLVCARYRILTCLCISLYVCDIVSQIFLSALSSPFYHPVSSKGAMQTGRLWVDPTTLADLLTYADCRFRRAVQVMLDSPPEFQRWMRQALLQELVCSTLYVVLLRFTTAQHSDLYSPLLVLRWRGVTPSKSRRSSTYLRVILCLAQSLINRSLWTTICHWHWMAVGLAA